MRTLARQCTLTAVTALALMASCPVNAPAASRAGMHAPPAGASNQQAPAAAVTLPLREAIGRLDVAEEDRTG